MNRMNILPALYAHYLRAHNFDIRHCPHLALIKDHLLAFHPALLILNADISRKVSGDYVGGFNFSRDFPYLRVVTVGYNLTSKAFEQLMSAGVCSHINRGSAAPRI